MPGRERAQDGDIAVGQRQQVAQHQRGHALAQRDLDLRHAIGRGHRGDHGAQGQQQVADVARQHMAFAHVGHIAALALMEAHQHAALLRHHPHRQAGAVAVAPGRALGRQHARGTELADVPEGVLQRTLLDRHLGAGLQVLHGTAATDAKMRAARHHALRGRTQDLLDAGDFIGGLAAHGGGHHAFARQGALHEHDLALAAGDAAGFQVKGFDIQNVRHLARSRITCNRALCERRSAAAARAGPPSARVRAGRAAGRLRSLRSCAPPRTPPPNVPTDGRTWSAASCPWSRPRPPAQHPTFQILVTPSL